MIHIIIILHTLVKVWLTPVALIAAVLLVVLVILAVVFRQKVMGLLSSVYTAIRSCICCENNNTEVSKIA